MGVGEERGEGQGALLEGGYLFSRVVAFASVAW